MNKSHATLLEKVLGSLSTEVINLLESVNIATGVKNSEEREVTISAEVEYWGNGEWHTEQTNWYSMVASKTTQLCKLQEAYPPVRRQTAVVPKYSKGKTFEGGQI
ncbi:MAG TPA: hypothetical protein VEJ67_00560 [Candidatus Cybelea sp.]|nr:hypothetical protein [Candidatus Cybelea sp.]